jgi:uncharacterized BrkB/YihY/UPF0761 family membrane protein
MIESNEEYSGSLTDQEYYPIPQPDEISKREKEDAMGAYLMMFAALGAGLPLPMINLIASIVYYYVNRGKSRFVRFHLIQSLWSQLPVTLLNGALVVWTVRIFYTQGEFGRTFMGLLFAAVLFNIVYVGFSLYAASLARKGRFYYFVFFGRLAYHLTFKIRENKFNEPEQNKPPI